jgi:uncharacterized protein with NAD-binding domain and iron-sulfur cluster
MANGKVVILGGGIGGLSAAHELVERRFDVEIYEMLPIAGGKARSFELQGSGTEGRRDLPGEHGFRFFPRFYRHIVETMARIPTGNGGNVADNLVDTTRCQFARFGRRPFELSARAPRSLNDTRLVLDDLGRLLGGDLGLSHDDLAFFGSKVWQIVTSCRERRMTEYEQLAWWDFIEAESRSPFYRKLLGHGITRSLVAAKAQSASTKTIGDIFVQLIFDIITPGPSTDRVLNGPTNDVWITPWTNYLKSRGVHYFTDSKARAVTFEDGHIRSATIDSPTGSKTVTGDYFIFALPVEDVIDLITPAMIQAEPALQHLFTLDDITEWMNGIQIYLNEDVPIAHGHTIYVDSPWALTSISQAQFWKHVNFGELGDGRVRGVISVDISEWEEKGLNGKRAKDCTSDEIKDEVWQQLKRSLNFGDTVMLRDDQVVHWSVDPDIRRNQDGTATNEEPLLVNLVDTWKLRPEAVTRIPNLFLASDYVRTYTDLATMEAANEAARRAVNGILDAAGSREQRCGIWDLYEPEIFMPWRQLDAIRFAQGLPWDDALVKVGLSVASMVDRLITALEQGADEHTIFGAPTGSGLDVIKRRVASFIDRNGPGPVSDLRRDATSVLERIGQLVAIRLVEAQGGRRAPTSLTAGPSLTAVGTPGASGQERRGGLEIIPH